MVAEAVRGPCIARRRVALPIANGLWVPCVGSFLAQLTQETSMLENFFCAPKTLRRLRTGPERTVHRRLRGRAHSCRIFGCDCGTLSACSCSPRVLRAPRSCRSRSLSTQALSRRSLATSLVAAVPIERRRDGLSRVLRSEALSTISRLSSTSVATARSPLRVSTSQRS